MCSCWWLAEVRAHAWCFLVKKMGVLQPFYEVAQFLPRGGPGVCVGGRGCKGWYDTWCREPFLCSALLGDAWGFLFWVALPPPEVLRWSCPSFHRAPPPQSWQENKAFLEIWLTFPLVSGHRKTAHWTPNGLSWVSTQALRGPVNRIQDMGSL